MPSRRDVLRASTVGALGALAGCNALPFVGADRAGEPALVESTNVHHRARFGASVALGEDLLVVGAPEALTRAYTFGGAAFVYERADGAWVKQARLRPASEDIAGPNEDRAQLSFGSYVAAADGTVVVGSAKHGVAYTYQRSGSGWQREQSISPAVEPLADEQRYPNEVAVSSTRCTSLSFDGETLVLSAAAGLEEASGTVETVHVYERRNYDWQEVAAFARENPAEFDRYGYATAVDGDTLVAGGTAGGEGDGAFQSVVYTFERAEDGWQKQENFRPESAVVGPSGRQRDSIALDGDVLAVGGLDATPGQSSSVLVYDRGDGQWTHRETLHPDVPGDLSDFGVELALDGGTLVAGAPGTAVDTDIDGTAFRYGRDGQDWTLKRRYTEGGAVRPGAFGHSVALSQDRVAIGGLLRRDDVADRPAIYVFPR